MPQKPMKLILADQMTYSKRELVLEARWDNPREMFASISTEGIESTLIVLSVQQLRQIADFCVGIMTENT
jgi:hypothetical protein